MSNNTSKSERELTPEGIAEYVYDHSDDLQFCSALSQTGLASIIRKYGDKRANESGKDSASEVRVNALVRPTHGQKVYRISVCAYEHGCPTLADFQAENDEQATKIANKIISGWEEATGDGTYRWYLHPRDEPNKDIPV